jgi:hypothetical protein
MGAPEIDLTLLDNVADPELRRTLESLGRVMAERERENPRQEPEKLPAKVIQFPLFPNETRPVSNDMARSALFACVQGKDRQMVKDELLATVNGVEIRFTGETFNQDDHDLLMQLVFMASHKPLGEYTTVPAHAILKALGRNTGGDQHKQLQTGIERLTNGGVKLKGKRLDYIGHLIDAAFQDKKSKYWVYRLSPESKQFFSLHNYTLVDWEQRKKLKGKDLARWVQLYIASHAAPFPVSVEYLHEKSGSQSKNMFHFRAKLRLALKDLEANKDIEAWTIDENDLLHVDRGKAITDSQSRHLTRPKARQKPKK